jgi:hypothetical protein
MSKETDSMVTNEHYRNRPHGREIASPVGSLRYAIGDTKGERVSLKPDGGIKVVRPQGTTVPDWINADIQANRPDVLRSLEAEQKNPFGEDFEDSWVAGRFDAILRSLEAMDAKAPEVDQARALVWKSFETVDGEWTETGFQKCPFHWRDAFRKERFFESVEEAYAGAYRNARYLKGDELGAAVQAVFAAPETKPKPKPAVNLEAFEKEPEPVVPPKKGSRWFAPDTRGRPRFEVWVSDVVGGETVVYQGSDGNNQFASVESFVRDFREKVEKQPEKPAQTGLFDMESTAAEVKTNEKEKVNVSTAKPIENTTVPVKTGNDQKKRVDLSAFE